MDRKKYDAIWMYIQKITLYSCYIDCFARIMNEFIENGDGNLHPCDLPNLSELTTKLAHRLYRIILKLKTDWEFSD